MAGIDANFIMTLLDRFISPGMCEASGRVKSAATRNLHGIRQQTLRTGCKISIVVIALGAISDHLFYPEWASNFLIIRMTSISIIGLMLMALRSKPAFSNGGLWIGVILLTSAISWIVTFMIWHAEGAGSSYYGGYLLVLMGLTFILRVSPLESVLYGLYVMAQYVFAVYAHNYNLLDFAVDAPPSPAPMSELLSPDYLFPAGGFFIAMGAILCSVGAWHFTLETFRRLIKQEHLSEAREDLAHVIAVASHEIKTPVQYLLTFAERLIAMPAVQDDPDAVAISRGMGLCSQRLLSETSKLAEAARMGDGGWHESSKANKPEPYSADEPLKLLREASEISGRFGGVMVSWVQKTEPDQLHLLGNVSDITQIVGNVLDNALKFTREGGRIDVGISCSASKLLVVIEDDGPGMNAEVLGALFRPWKQGSQSTLSRNHGGFGLGMSIVKARLDNVGGSIEINSAPDEGTRVVIGLPRSIGASVVDTEYDEAAIRVSFMSNSVTTKNDLEWFSFQNAVEHVSKFNRAEPVVLVVDDEPVIHQAVRAILEEHYQCFHAINAAEALQAVADKQPNVIVMDVMMPGMDGIETIRAIRRMENLSGVQIIVSSAVDSYRSVPLIKAAIDAGAQDLIAKPFTSLELAQRVRANILTSQLNQSLKETANRLSTAHKRLMQSESMRTVSTLGNGLLHNIGNPLGGALTTFRALAERHTDVSEIEMKRWKAGLQLLNDVARQISELKRWCHPDKSALTEDVEIEYLVRMALNATGLRDSPVCLESQFDSGFVRCNSFYIIQILIAFLLNAKDAVRDVENPTITIGTRRKWVNGMCKLDIFVADNGPGLSDQTPIFDAYYTEKDVGQGTGMGLYVAGVMANSMGATIDVGQSASGGALFTLQIDAVELEVA